MKANSLLTLHVKEEAAVLAVSARLEAKGFETKISYYDNKIVLATNALPRTLRKARQEEPHDMVGFIAMLAASVKEKSK